MNTFFIQHHISFLLITLFLKIGTTYANESAKVAPSSFDLEKAARIKKLQTLSLEELQQVRIIPQSKEKLPPSKPKA